MIKSDKIHDECGLFGVYNTDCANDAADIIHYGLYALQHRGQQSCGIVVNDDGTIVYHKDSGIVPDVFAGNMLQHLRGSMGIGHVRYSEFDGGRENAQPLVSKYKKGTLAVAHNGSVVNAAELREQFENTGAIFQSTSDAELIAFLIARERIACHSIEEAVSRAIKHLRGSFALVVMSPRKLIGARGPQGIRPLCIGKTDNSYILASETCALDAVDAKFVRDVQAGEVVCIDNDGVRSDMSNSIGESNICIFEYIYFARPDSVIDGVSVYEARRQAGILLAEQYPVEADVVIPVPDSGIDAAIGYAAGSGIPYGVGFIKNRYIGRTFVLPTQEQRVEAVKIKLNGIAAAVRGKRVVMVDDSIVRGTTSHKLVQMLRDCGATEVHVRISSPPFVYPCYFGTDIPTQDSLIACSHTTDQIREKLGANSLGFLKKSSLPQILGGKKIKYCDACFSGNYCVDVPFDGRRIDIE